MPDAHLLVGGEGRHRTAVQAEEGIVHSGVVRERRDLPSRTRFPHPCRPVRARGDYPPPVRREHRPVDLAVVRQRGDIGAAPGVPDARRAVGPCRHHQGARRPDGDVHDAGAGGFEGWRRRRAGLAVPHAGRSIGAQRNDVLAVHGDVSVGRPFRKPGPRKRRHLARGRGEASAQGQVFRRARLRQPGGFAEPDERPGQVALVDQPRAVGDVHADQALLRDTLLAARLVPLLPGHQGQHRQDHHGRRRDGAGSPMLPDVVADDLVLLDAMQRCGDVRHRVAKPRVAERQMLRRPGPPEIEVQGFLRHGAGDALGDGSRS